MFLRLGWTVAQAGIGLACVIVLMSSVVTSLTTASMSAIATNGEVKAGGAYYLISRSLGPEFGGAIGALFSLGNSVAIALYVIGFCETLVTQMFDIWSPTGDKLNDTRLFGIALCIILLILALVGVGWVIKMQIGLLVLLCLSILSFIVGSFYRSDVPGGVPGLADSQFSANFAPEYREFEGLEYDFFKTFAVFFPAVTGIMAGANISGDLTNPSKAIPLGTFASIGLSTVVYLIMTVLVGSVAIRYNPLDDSIGLLNDNLVMVKVSVWGPLVLAGIYAATFSSALASLVGAPRILMSVAHDQLIPALQPFAKTRERDGSPTRGYFLCFGIACGCVLIGKLNAIAPLISMFFMMTYALINLSCFRFSTAKTPGWRPQFKYYWAYGSLLGTILCIVAMFLTNVLYAIVSLAIAAVLYFYIQWRKPDVNWGSASEAQAQLDTLHSMMKLRANKKHVKTFRPSYLVMSGEPAKRMRLVRFVATLQKGFGAVVFGNVVTGDYLHTVEKLQRSAFFEQDGIVGFQDHVVAPNFRLGAQSLLQLSGMGTIRPNTMVLGFKDDWEEHSHDDIDGYVGSIRDAFRLRYGVVIGRGLEAISWDPEDAMVAKTGTIDVYWMFDDGGLSVLIPWILSRHPYWKKHGTKVRLLVVVDNANAMSGAVHDLVWMIRKFRFDWEAEAIPTNGQGPSPETVARYEKMTGKPVDEQHRPNVTRKWLRLSEIMRENSCDAALTFCSLRFPRDNTPSDEWLASMDILTDQVSETGERSPILLIRGNGRDCLTFRSE
jgi:solute carrier family 12 (sodium/potassium/chloride transporter), member 2